ncbi:MAG: FHA domain-containing protein [Methylococcales bacterium]|nr:FHA domain-containing protein [Methylococcales bacterium]
MVKFTVSCDNSPVNALILDKNIIHLGQNSDNDLVIDDPNVAAIHATITLKGYAYSIAEKDSNYPLFINHKKVKKARLFNNDKISIGDHNISFNSARIIIPHESDKTSQNYAAPLKKLSSTVSASLQILNGPHIGEVLSLTKNKINFGKKNTVAAVISKEPKGYTLTQQSDAEITLNYETLEGGSEVLNDTDIIIIENISMQFFTNH